MRSESMIIQYFTHETHGLHGQTDIICFSVELDGLGMDTYVERTLILMASLMKNWNVWKETVQR